MGKRKEFIGEVVSDKMLKTVVVRIMQTKKDVKYSRISKTFNKFKAHDEAGVAKLGDTVRIEETRPISKDKHFRVLGIVKKAEGLEKIEIKEEI